MRKKLLHEKMNDSKKSDQPKPEGRQSRPSMQPFFIFKV
jgi:hypothetical protein